MIIKYRWKIYSDRNIEFPQAYFYGVFPQYQAHLWEIVDVDGPCLTVETTSSYEVTQETLEPVFNSITPDVFVSTTRSYIKQ